MTEQTNDKARENKARRAAARQGLLLSKSGSRDPNSPLYGVWYLTKITSHGNARTIASGNLDVIELALTQREATL